MSFVSLMHILFNIYFSDVYHHNVC